MPPWPPQCLHMRRERRIISAGQVGVARLPGRAAGHGASSKESPATGLLLGAWPANEQATSATRPSNLAAAAALPSPVMPMATPMSASLSAGASFTPSPVMAVTSPISLSSRTMSCRVRKGRVKLWQGACGESSRKAGESAPLPLAAVPAAHLLVPRLGAREAETAWLRQHAAPLCRHRKGGAA